MCYQRTYRRPEIGRWCIFKFELACGAEDNGALIFVEGCECCHRRRRVATVGANWCSAEEHQNFGLACGALIGSILRLDEVASPTTTLAAPWREPAPLRTHTHAIIVSCCPRRGASADYSSADDKTSHCARKTPSAIDDDDAHNTACCLRPSTIVPTADHEQCYGFATIISSQLD